MKAVCVGVGNLLVWIFLVTNVFAQALPPGGRSGGTNNYDSPLYTVPDYGTNLWLSINLSNNVVHLLLHNATDMVYEVWGKTDLTASSWNIEQEVWPGTNQDVTPFTVPELDRTNLFIWARDWTGVDENTNGIPDWWEWKYFGNFNQPTNGDYDGDGVDNLTEYLSGTDPNKIQFILQFTNNYLNTGIVYGTITVLSGVPSYEAVLVNDTNFTDANWRPYNPTVVVPLNSGDENYDVWVGLRGLPSDAQQNWQWAQLTLDTVAPTLTITNPASSVVSQPVIQLQGYADETLGGLTFDVSNATGILTNRQGYWQAAFYDTNLLTFTTNSFQCYDIALTNGLNTITIHATDLAGNTTTTNFNVTLDYSGDITAPALNIIWPQDGTYISGSQFTLQGQVDDATAKITAFIVDAGGNTNSVQGLVERNGTVWAQNLPLAAGANALTITATDAAGNTSVTNLTLFQSSVTVTLDPLAGSQLNQALVSVSGTVSDATAQVYVNGVQALVNEDGTWEADAVPVGPTGTAIFDVEVYGGSNPNVTARVQARLRLQANDVPTGLATGSEQFLRTQPSLVQVSSFQETQNFSQDYYDPCYQSPVKLTEKGAVNWVIGVGGYSSYGGLQTGPLDQGGGCDSEIENWPTNWPNGQTLEGDGSCEGNFSVSPNIAWQYCLVNQPRPYSTLADCGEINGTLSFTRKVETKIELVAGRQVQKGAQQLILLTASAAAYSSLAIDQAIGDTSDLSESPGDVPLPASAMRILGQTPKPTATNANVGNLILTLPAGAVQDITPTINYPLNQNDYSFNVQATELDMQLAVENNRDGQINFDNSDATTPAKPFRFWINDSQESGDDETSGGTDDQIPGVPYTNALQSVYPNYRHGQVQGRNDLVNFFPAVLCLSNTLQLLPPSSGYEYHLYQADRATIGGAVKFVYTSLAPTNEFEYLTNTASFGYGTNFDEAAMEADTIPVNPDTTLDTNWLAHVQNHGGTGIILLEGCAATPHPLMLEIWRDGKLLTGVPLYLSMSSVEQMFRHVNFCYVNGTVTVPARPDVPNEPPTVAKHFVFLHGYNVNQQQARGVESEMFKRFYWSGSKAKFYGVTWNGAVSQSDFIHNVSCNFQTNVENALQTASHLANFLGTLPADKTVVAAHSLGNMVVLSAISDYNAQPGKYFMIDCAVPMEAVRGDTPYEPAMIPSAWQQYSNRTFASMWWQLFADTDARSTLTWSNRLGNLGNVDIYNFYSYGEEVLREDDEDPPSGILSGGATQLINYWGASVPFGTYVWVWQEKGKGNALHDDFISSTHGGWKFSYYWTDSFGTPLSPSIMNDTPNLILQYQPMFSFPSSMNGQPDDDLLGADGSAYAQAHRDRILSDAIPALTLPVGANFVALFNDRAADKRNFHMQDEFEEGWPGARLSSREGNKWHHSDFDCVAYPFTHKLFDEIVNDGGLK